MSDPGKLRRNGAGTPAHGSDIPDSGKNKSSPPQGRAWAWILSARSCRRLAVRKGGQGLSLST